MPTKNGSGRGSGSTATTNPPGNQTPNTPDINESEIARLKVDQLRDRLRRRGVTGTADMRKDDLVKALVKAMKDGAKKSTSAGAGGSPGSGSSRSGSSRSGSSAKKTTSSSANPPGNQTPNTPDVNESEIAQLKVDELRGRLRARGVAGTADMQKADLVKALVKSLRDNSGASSSPGGGGVRKGPQTSKSIKYAQEVTSVDDEPERPGRSLVTTDHEVIRRWAEARKGLPTTVDGTEHDGHAGVLRFDFPSNGREQRLREISWEEWFRAFDERRLNFIYQEERSDGKQSNFFRLESPDREDG
ncbi:SAP domain-containing protein [Micromonospora sp. A3M-1-15]|uniref:SAP domain-containing protein n=1 Tax=Micromonospora sp. A3M-1-15 TaxID=2962035 RepID=UPI0020B8A4BB|nr:SAP domain-containing protein [Micromonospora sp. A3M-1-15]MCP3783595.1 SAP domain-containing protein [Micromonospora sp. A3M-1-15]